MKQKIFQILAALCCIVYAMSAQALDTKRHYGLSGPKLTYQTPIVQSHHYMVNGVGYRTQTSKEAGAYAREGVASLYHKKFNGRKTASGQIYNENLYTAAHKTLPLNSYVLVTNLRNQRKVIVRINDRGPFVKGRIIDLSRAAAREIGMIGSGIGNVRVEMLQLDTQGRISGPATTTLAKLAKNQEASNKLLSVAEPVELTQQREQKATKAQRAKSEKYTTLYKIRILNFDSKKQAETLTSQLGRDDVRADITVNQDKFDIYFGPFSDKAQVNEVKAQLRSLNYSKPLIVYTFDD
ncbi:septal ring lytic transglycosylase RlpA family protein [Bisgaard Taxon 45]